MKANHETDFAETVQKLIKSGNGKAAREALRPLLMNEVARAEALLLLAELHEAEGSYSTARFIHVARIAEGSDGQRKEAFEQRVQEALLKIKGFIPSRRRMLAAVIIWLTGSVALSMAIPNSVPLELLEVVAGSGVGIVERHRIPILVASGTICFIGSIGVAWITWRWLAFRWKRHRMLLLPPTTRAKQECPECRLPNSGRRVCNYCRSNQIGVIPSSIKLDPLIEFATSATNAPTGLQGTVLFQFKQRCRDMLHFIRLRERLKMQPVKEGLGAERRGADIREPIHSRVQRRRVIIAIVAAGIIVWSSAATVGVKILQGLYVAYRTAYPRTASDLLRPFAPIDTPNPIAREQYLAYSGRLHIWLFYTVVPELESDMRAGDLIALQNRLNELNQLYEAHGQLFLFPGRRLVASTAEDGDWANYYNTLVNAQGNADWFAINNCRYMADLYTLIATNAAPGRRIAWMGSNIAIETQFQALDAIDKANRVEGEMRMGYGISPED